MPPRVRLADRVGVSARRGGQPGRAPRPAGPAPRRAAPEPARVLGGRDEIAGGTWLAVNDRGVVAGLTNRPAPGGRDPTKRSRGELPLLAAEQRSADEAVSLLLSTVRAGEYNPAWLLVGDRRALFYVELAADRDPTVRQLAPGIHVLENVALEEASVKADRVRSLVSSAPFGAGGPVDRPPAGPRRPHAARGRGRLDRRSRSSRLAAARPPWPPVSTPMTTAPARRHWCECRRTRPGVRRCRWPTARLAPRPSSTWGPGGPTDTGRPGTSDAGSVHRPGGSDQEEVPPRRRVWGATTTSGRCAASTRRGALGGTVRCHRARAQVAPGARPRGRGAVSRSASR